MEDKTYIEALMNAPSREEQDRTLKDAVLSKDFKRRFGRNLAYIIAVWRQVEAWTEADESGK